MNSYLAVDIGASSGRHIVSWMEDGKIRMQEIYRFDNGIKRANKDGHLCWNTERLFREILNGMKKCKEEGFIPKSMGIDTWGVDFVLLDPEDNQIRRFFHIFPKEICMKEPESRNRILIRSIS